MSGDEGDPVAIRCPREASPETAEIGSDLLIFFTEKPLSDPFNTFTRFGGHQHNLEKPFISCNIRDNIATR